MRSNNKPFLPSPCTLAIARSSFLFLPLTRDMSYKRSTNKKARMVTLLNDQIYKSMIQTGQYRKRIAR